MGYARKSLISLRDTPYYHVVARCVRRSWLWGFDRYAGKDYSHRKAWVLERLEHLSKVFAIDVCAYAVMSNHYHLVVHVDQHGVRQWTAENVVERWEQVYGLPPFIDRWRRGVAEPGESEYAAQWIAQRRERLSDVSWYMRCLNEHLARRANAEDECTGRFWEGRFRSQALLDEAGLLTAMAYVDLNPVRAGIAATPEESEFTSVYARIRKLRVEQGSSKAARRSTHPHSSLLPFRSAGMKDKPAIPFGLLDYLQVLDWSGRVIRAGKRGAIAENAPPILQRLSIDSDAWQIAMRPYGNVFGRALGRLDHLRLHARTLGQSWVRGGLAARRLYRTT